MGNLECKRLTLTTGQQARTNHSTRSGSRHTHRTTEAGDGWGHSAAGTRSLEDDAACQAGRLGDPASPVTCRVPSSAVLKPGVPILSVIFVVPEACRNRDETVLRLTD